MPYVLVAETNLQMILDSKEGLSMKYVDKRHNHHHPRIDTLSPDQQLLLNLASNLEAVQSKVLLTFR
jgi:hypothetical protein